MKKNNLRNYLKLGIFLFGILLIFTKCKDDYISEYVEEEQSLSLKVYDIKDLEKLKPLIDNVKNIRPKNNTTNFNRNFEEFLDLENLNTQEIIEITDSEGNATFTFKIENVNNDGNTYNFENLHLVETQEGYIGYILSYEPNIFWFEDSITKDGLVNLDMSNYQGDITKYSLERDIIWSTSTQARASGNIVCTYSVAVTCTEAWEGVGSTEPHTATSQCTNSSFLTYQTIETCVESNDGGGGYDDNTDATPGSGNPSNEPDDCNNVFGTSIVNNQPIVGVNMGCTLNNTIGIQPERISLVTSLETLLDIDLSWQQEVYLNEHYLEAENIEVYLTETPNSPQAQALAYNAIVALTNETVDSFSEYIETILDTPLSVLTTPTISALTLEDYKFRIKLSGSYFKNLNNVFSETQEMLTDISNDASLSLNDFIYIENIIDQTYTTIKPYKDDIISLDETNLTGINNLNQILSPLELATIETNLLTTAFLPHVKSLVGDHWPQTNAEWSAIGTIMGQFMLEIGLAVIPGSSIVDVVAGANDGDYMLVTLGIVGLVVDAFGGTIIKVIAKIGKVAYKTFKIFKVVFRYLDEVVDFITLGFKTDLVNGIVKISDTIGNTVAEIQNNVIKLLKNSAKAIIKVADLKYLDNISPTSLGHINASKINNKALRIKPENSDYADDIADIVQNGDQFGNKTETIVQDLLHQDGFVAQTNVQLLGNQGFDNVFIKRDTSGNITDIIINESKQVSNVGTISLSSNVAGTSGSACVGCTQMSQNWIDDVIIRMQQQGGDLSSLANEINSFGITNITQVVSGVNKSTSELVILNITGFN